MKTMKSFKKVISILLCAIMVLSILPIGSIEAEAETTYTYPKISALKVPRIQQPGTDTTGMCHFNSIASIIAYRLGSYSYDGYSRSYSYGTDYAYSSDPVWQKMYDVNSGSMDPTYSFSEYPVEITSKKVSGNNSETYKLIYDQLKLGNPVVVYGPYHASVVIGYTASTNSLDASKFSVMEITKDGSWWSNSKSYFDSYANAPQTDRATNGPMPCYVTLSSWLTYCGVSISRISYCEGTLSVSFNANGGSISSSDYYLSSGLIYNSSDKSKKVQKWYYNNKKEFGLIDDTTFGLKRDGYTFVGWGTTASGGTIFDKSDANVLPTDLNPNVKKCNCSVTLYAIWEKAETKYTVTYSDHGNTEVPSPVTVEAGGTIYISDTILESFGKTFIGWNETGDVIDGYYPPGTELAVNEDITLYAVWLEAEIAVNEVSTIYIPGELYVKFTPEKTGYYIFYTLDDEEDVIDTVGTVYDSSQEELITDDDSGESNNFKMIYYLSEDNVYYTKIESYDGSWGYTIFNIDPVPVLSYDANGGYNAPDAQDYSDVYEITYDQPSRDGYTFLGWSTGESSGLPEYYGGEEISLDYDTTLYAVWEEIPVYNVYELAYDANGGTGAPESQIFEEGETIYISSEMPTRFGYVFNGWEDSDGVWYCPGEEVVFYESTSLKADWRNYTILEGDSILLYMGGNDAKEFYMKFEPEKSGNYVFATKYTDDELDTIGTLYDASANQLGYSDDVNGYNFEITYYLEAGQTYYICVESYNDTEGSSVLTLTYADTPDPDVPTTDPDIPTTNPDVPTTNPDEPTTDPDIPTTNPDESTTNPDIPTTNPDEPTTNPVKPTPDPDSDLNIEIINPSTTKINYKNGIILHAKITGALPEGATVVWETSNGNFRIDRSDASSCKIISNNNGLTDITVKIVSADGEVLVEDYVTMTSNVSFFQKIIAFFKDLFGILPEILPQAFKKIV